MQSRISAGLQHVENTGGSKGVSSHANTSQSDSLGQISPKFPTNTTDNNTSKDNHSSFIHEERSVQGDNGHSASQLFYSDLNVVSKNGYIPAAGVGIANQHFSNENGKSKLKPKFEKSNSLGSHMDDNQMPMARGG